jgi:hypothetical protein
METISFFLSIILVIIINIRPTKSINYYDDDNSSSSSLNSLSIILPLVVGFIVVLVVYIICKKKYTYRSRTSILPLSTQMAIVQQENQYAPPAYNYAPPYGQPPPYEQPPPYSASVPIEPMKETVTS